MHKHWEEDSKMDKLSHHPTWFWDVVEASSLKSLLYILCTKINPSLCMSLTKRWHEEITTLHFPIGKMTIIIDDVSCLLHLPTHGILMNHQT